MNPQNIYLGDQHNNYDCGLFVILHLGILIEKYQTQENTDLHQADYIRHITRMVTRLQTDITSILNNIRQGIISV